MTRILITSINYAPEETGIAPYTTKLAEHLARQGYAVTAVTGMPHYPGVAASPERYAGALALREFRNGVEVERRWHYVPRAQSALRRGLYEATFLATGLSSLALPPPHAVLGVVPSLSGGLIARMAAARFGVPYGLVFQDLVGQAAGQSGIARRQAGERDRARGRRLGGARRGRGRRHRRGLPAVRRGAGRRAGADPPRAQLDARRRGRPSSRDAMREWLGLPHDATVCLHAGNMGHKQGLENVIECARLAAASAPRLLFAFVGDGSQRAMLEAMARALRAWRTCAFCRCSRSRYSRACWRRPTYCWSTSAAASRTCRCRRS